MELAKARLPAPGCSCLVLAAAALPGGLAGGGRLWLTV